MSFDASASSSAGRRLRSSRASSPSIFASSPFCADTGKICVGGIPRSAAAISTWRSIWAATGARASSPSHRLSILFSTTILAAFCAGSSPARSRRHTSRSRLGDACVGGEDEQDDLALGKRLSVSSGSAPTALSPGVSRITRPCCSSGCGKLMIACRQRRDLDALVAAARQSGRQVPRPRPAGRAPGRARPAPASTSETRASSALILPASDRSSGNVAHSSAYSGTPARSRP